MDVIAGVKENEMYNNFTMIVYNESMPFSVEEYKEYMLLANDMYKVEVIIPDAWRSINRYWWNFDDQIELIDYATKYKKWECGKIGFKIIQKF